jgi:hypothetical protein
MSGKQLNVKMGLRKERKRREDWFNSSKERIWHNYSGQLMGFGFADLLARVASFSINRKV